MNLLEKRPQIDVHPIAEFKMGAMGYGLTIHTAYGAYDFLKDIPTLIGTDKHVAAVEMCKDERYFRVSGPDIQYILDSKYMKASIYRIMVRATSEKEAYAWSESTSCYSEENCVFGKNTEHIRGFQGPIYLQCPWVEQSEILALVIQYKAFRENQLLAAMKAF